MKRIVILGATGSIGENALRVVDTLPGEFEVVGLSARRNAARLVELAKAHGARRIALSDPAAAAEARALAGREIEVLDGEAGAVELAAASGVDLVVCAIVGMAALRPVLAAVEAGHDVAIATKEVLVACGAVVTRRCAEKGVRLLPVDSEHSAIFQALQDPVRAPWCVRTRPMEARDGAPERTPLPAEDRVGRLILTASGGPFFFRPEIDFETVTPEAALNHPRWKMGPKVTVDSASMMNKGLEIMEAAWLFAIPVDRIAVAVHPQSLVHSLVEYKDASVMAQLGATDMRIAIQYAMCWPERLPNASLPKLDLVRAGKLEFYEPDETRFPCLRIARSAFRQGGAAPAVMNAANEIAVDAFLKGRIRFADIPRLLEKTLSAPGAPTRSETLEDVLGADEWARRTAASLA